MDLQDSKTKCVWGDWSLFQTLFLSFSYLKHSSLHVSTKYFRKKVFPFQKTLNLTFYLRCPFASVRLNKAIRKYAKAISKYKINGKELQPSSLFSLRKKSAIFNILKNSLFFLNMNDMSLLDNIVKNQNNILQS